MMQYPRVPVGKVLSLARTPVHISAAEEYRAIGIRSFGKGLFHYPPTAGADLSKLRYFQYPAGALALSNIKAWEGAVAVTTEADRETVASNRFLLYIPQRPDEVDVGFLRYFFLSEGGLAELNQASPGSADRNRTLSISSFEKVRVPFPDIEEQRRIAAKLNASMAHQERIDERATQVGQYTSALLESLYKRDWPRRSISSLLQPERVPVDSQPDTRYEAIGVRSFGKGLIRYSSVFGSELSKLRYFKFPQDALVVSNIQAWEGAVAVSTAEDASHRIASNRFLFYIPQDPEKVDVRFVCYYLLTRPGLLQLNEASPGSADRNRTLSIQSFECIQVPIPKVEVQREVADALDGVYLRLFRLGERRKELNDALRPALLNAAFSGEL